MSFHRPVPAGPDFETPDADMPTRPWILAIDLGTSYTVTSARIGDAPAEVIEIDGERRTPSVVHVDADGTLSVGRRAEDLAANDPGRLVRRPKTRLGEPTPIVVGGQARSVVELTGAILAHVRDEAVRHVGTEPAEVRLTHPATWGGPRRTQLLAAAEAAGIDDPVLVPEPVAAAIAYLDAAEVDDGTHVLVYDLGGGTFDTAALRSTPHGFIVVGRPIGDPGLGGELFDELVANWIGERLDPDVWQRVQLDDDPMWRQSAATLQREAKRVKEALSGVESADAVVALPTGMAKVTMTRADLDGLIRPYVAESVELRRRPAPDAGLTDAAVAAISMVGGASRSPLVGEMLATEFPDVAITRRGDPKAAVAIGASHPTATPTSLANRTSLDTEASLAGPAATVADTAPPTPPTRMDTAFGASPGDEASPARPSPAASRRRRLVAAGAVALVAVVAVAGAVVVLGGGAEEAADAPPAGQTATDAPTTTVGSRPVGGGPVTVPRPDTADQGGTPQTTAPPPTSSTTPPTTAPSTTAPTTPPDDASPPAAVTDPSVLRAALIEPEAIGAEWAVVPLVDDEPICGQAQVLPVLTEATAIGRGVDSPSYTEVVHTLTSYTDPERAAAAFDEAGQLLSTCPNDTLSVAGFTYRLTVNVEPFDMSELAPGCSGLIAIVQASSTDSPIPQLWSAVSVVRCGLYGSSTALTSASFADVADEALLERVNAATLTNLFSLPGSLTE